MCLYRSLAKGHGENPSMVYRTIASGTFFAKLNIMFNFEFALKIKSLLV
jgi:hypothetical protein